MNKGLSKRVLSPLKRTASGSLSSIESLPPKTEAPEKLRTYKDFINRTIFTIAMAYVFLVLISLGVEVVIPLVIAIECTMFYEITRINQRARKDRQLVSMFVLKLWFLGSTIFLVTSHSIREPLVATFPWLLRYYANFGMFAFGLPMIGIVGFVLSLRKGMYRYQFIQFTWIVMTLLFTVIQGGIQIKNMMRGMIWFLLPVSCVVNNDIWAYAFGKMFGRTRLLALSPKKTLEGFLGAFLFTMAWSFWFAGFLGYFPELYCPKVDFHSSMHCEKDPLFVQRAIVLPSFIQKLTGNYLTTIQCSKAQQHALVLAAFASLLAPFGGFFASGLKRAFKLKDFGDLIPGHGGITDRMDCQGMMGVFTYVYLMSYVYSDAKCPSLHDLSSCALRLSDEGKIRLMRLLNESLSKGF
ncbi:putative CDP-DAG synthase [Trypanosoma cruzi]|uniref:Phosphatidate cytidylyltransferase n=2 Tax=Trypanosoma cruzi TaxID=5693 RepID=Q4D7D0_TRYCC|nr:CDP-diacylglycerol synthetase, putative [Trypanosoma cruzi]EAN88425.1 CDP-diacylglycerol synthetase, putative [Trypanosoma cruzi]PWV14037.1 putative CDP-DAG synthase [Trypanosoma cruzi]RNC38534.1 putative CDP-diacylglycerol synthetase [Trypanosoma cruzi]|eukprot:XP_810276.1 CDP-diacylglycerol synthetase [Trypanosoma cruzi strain CL Brener]